MGAKKLLFLFLSLVYLQLWELKCIVLGCDSM